MLIKVSTLTPVAPSLTFGSKVTGSGVGLDVGAGSVEAGRARRLRAGPGRRGSGSSAAGGQSGCQQHRSGGHGQPAHTPARHQHPYVRGEHGWRTACVTNVPSAGDVLIINLNVPLEASSESCDALAVAESECWPRSLSGFSRMVRAMTKATTMKGTATRNTSSMARVNASSTQLLIGSGRAWIAVTSLVSIGPVGLRPGLRRQSRSGDA